MTNIFNRPTTQKDKTSKEYYELFFQEAGAVFLSEDSFLSYKSLEDFDFDNFEYTKNE